MCGVCAGLADRLGLDPTLVRVAFVVGSFLSSGLGLLAYVLLWAVMPEEDTVEDLLAERLERGEISAEEYREVLRDIDGTV